MRLRLLSPRADEPITAIGTPVLIAPESSTRKGIRPGWNRGRYAFMRRVLATDLGKTLYNTAPS